MRKLVFALMAGVPALIAAASPPPVPAPAPAATAAAPQPDLSLIHVQVILDRLGFSPGVIDGRPGMSLTAALKGFQQANGLPVTGEPDQATLQALAVHRAWRPVTRVTLTPAMLAGPYFPDLPHGEDAQAKLPALGYRRPLEKLAEMFHTTPDTLIALNRKDEVIRPGAGIVVPDVIAQDTNYDPRLPEEWRRTLAMLNVDARQPRVTKVVVSKSDKLLRAYDADGRLVAQFVVTTGSIHDPLPIGAWTIRGTDHNPRFHYNPALFWDAKKGDTRATLPPGPNGPVGVVWIDLSKEHYGIHGTPEPQLIGRTASHGCVRLTNWDAARLSMMVRPGTAAIFTA